MEEKLSRFYIEVGVNAKDPVQLKKLDGIVNSFNRDERALINKFDNGDVLPDAELNIIEILIRKAKMSLACPVPVLFYERSEFASHKTETVQKVDSDAIVAKALSMALDRGDVQEALPILEYNLVCCYYGICGAEKLSVAQICKKFNMDSEFLCQIVTNAVNKVMIYLNVNSKDNSRSN